MHDVELPVRIEGGEQRRREGDEDQKREDPEAPGRRAEPEEAPPPLLPYGAMPQRADDFCRDDEGDEQREPVAEGHAVTISASAAACTRRRGSAKPSKMSASRFPATTTVLAIKALAVTTG